MKLKYIIDRDPNHYILFHLDLVNKEISGQYSHNNIIDSTHKVSVADLVAMPSSKNMKVQVAKKGETWDFHLLKYDTTGKEHRRSVGLMIPVSVRSYRLVIINDRPKPIVLRNYVTHRLQIYKSPLRIAAHEFSSVNGISGRTSVHENTPVTTADNQLKVGEGGRIVVPILGGSPADPTSGLDARRYPFTFMMKVDSLAPSSDGSAPLSFRLGGNIFYIDRTKGISIGVGESVSLIAPADQVPESFVLRVVTEGEKAYLFIGTLRFEIPTFDYTTVITTVEILSNASAGTYTLIPYVHIHALENYRADAAPPKVITDLVVSGGENSVTINWTASDSRDLAGYRVYVNGKLHNQTIIKDVSYRLVDLPAGIPVTVSVTAVDMSGNESPSFHTTTVRTISNPDVEARGIVTHMNDAGVHFTWEAPVVSTEQTRFRIYRVNKKDGTKQELTTLDANKKSFTDYPLPKAGEYMYLITTIDVNGMESLGVEQHLQTKSKTLVVDDATGTLFDLFVPDHVETVLVSVNPTWTYTRDTENPTVFLLNYKNNKVGVDEDLPAIKLTGYVPGVGGTLDFKATSFSLSPGQDYSFTVEFKDYNGNVIDTDTVAVALNGDTAIDGTKITGLDVISPKGASYLSLVWNPLHKTNPSDIYRYYLYVNGVQVNYFSGYSVYNSTTGLCGVTLNSGFDPTKNYVISVTAKSYSKGEFGQMEITYTPEGIIRSDGSSGAVSTYVKPTVFDGYTLENNGGQFLAKLVTHVNGGFRFHFENVNYKEGRSGADRYDFYTISVLTPHGTISTAYLDASTVVNQSGESLSVDITPALANSKSFPMGMRVGIRVQAVRHRDNAIASAYGQAFTWDGTTHGFQLHDVGMPYFGVQQPRADYENPFPYMYRTRDFVSTIGWKDDVFHIAFDNVDYKYNTPAGQSLLTYTIKVETMQQRGVFIVLKSGITSDLSTKVILASLTKQQLINLGLNGTQCRIYIEGTAQGRRYISEIAFFDFANGVFAFNDTAQGANDLRVIPGYSSAVLPARYTLYRSPVNLQTQNMPGVGLNFRLENLDYKYVFISSFTYNVYIYIRNPIDLSIRKVLIQSGLTASNRTEAVVSGSITLEQLKTAVIPHGYQFWIVIICERDGHSVDASGSEFRWEDPDDIKIEEDPGPGVDPDIADADGAILQPPAEGTPVQPTPAPDAWL